MIKSATTNNVVIKLV